MASPFEFFLLGNGNLNHNGLAAKQIPSGRRTHNDESTGCRVLMRRRTLSKQLLFVALVVPVVVNNLSQA
jgi:hypothetical protein